MGKNSYYSIYLIDSITGSTGNYAKLDCEGIDFSSTFAVAEISDISKRKDAISKTLTFKATKNNNVVFGNASNLNKVVDDSVNLSFFFNFNITKDIDCIVLEGTTQILRGKLHFISCNRDKLGNITYECLIKGYLVDFFSKIQDKLISDLDFTNFNHTYDIYNIRNSWSNTDGYVYPLIDYGAGVTTQTNFDNYIDFRNMRPAFYLKEYFNTIFNQSGVTGSYRYTCTGSTAFVEEFNKAIVPNNDSSFSYAKSAGIFYEVAKTKNSQQFNGRTQTYIENGLTVFKNLISFDTTITGATTQTIIDTNVINGQIVTFKNKVNSQVTATVSYTSSQNSNTDIQLSFRLLYRQTPNDQFAEITSNQKDYTFTGINNFQQNAPATQTLTISQEFAAGSQITLLLYVNGKNINYFNVNMVNADLKIGSTLTTSQVEINFGDPAILVGQNFQSIKQSDFLKSVIQMFNLYVYPDPDDPNHIIFIPYNDFYQNFQTDKIINTSIDWTYKVDNSSFTQTPVSDVFYLYKFNFKDDSSFYNKYYLDKYGSTYGNLTLTGTTNGSDKSIDLIFGSTPVANYNGKNVPALWTLDSNNLKKQSVTSPRILFYNGLKSCPTYEIGRIELGTDNLYHFNSIDKTNQGNYVFGVYAEANEFTLSSDGEFVDLSFSTPSEVFYTNGGIINSYGSGKKNLYDRYYADQITEMTDSNTRIIETTAYLNENDIQNLNFKVPIFFNSVLGHNYFKLLSVEYSNANEPANIKLQTAYIKDTHTIFNGFQNITYGKLIQKNNCSSPYVGEAAYYIVPAGNYTSFESQIEADSFAKSEYLRSGQTYANTNGICANTGVTFTLGIADFPTDAVYTTGKTTYITNTGNLNTGSVLFDYSTGVPVRYIASYYGTNNNTYYQTNSYSVIISSGTTSISTTGSTGNNSGVTQTLYDAYFTFDNSQYTSCSSFSAGQPLSIFKITDPSPRIGTMIYNLDLSVPQDSYYSDGNSAYFVQSGKIKSIYNCNKYGGAQEQSI